MFRHLVLPFAREVVMETEINFISIKTRLRFPLVNHRAGDPKRNMAAPAALWL